MSYSKKVFKLFQNNEMFYFLFLVTVATSVGFQGWRTLLNNFAVDEVGLNGFLIGVIQSVREVPGFLVFTVIFLLLFIKEVKLAVYASLVLGVGVLLTGMMPSFTGMIITTVIMSIGFHYFETTNQSLVLQNFDKQESPHIMAMLRSVVAFSNIFVGILIYFMGQYTSFKISYIVLGIIVLAITFFAFVKIPKTEPKVVQQKKMIFKKRYWLFYVLNLLSGARRQIFVVFSILLLVEKYDVSVIYVSLLFILNNIIAIITNPLIAKAINRFGEKKVLSLEYISLTLIFLAYALIENVWIVASLYVLDHIFYNFSIGIKTYFQKHADAEDIAPSMAVGFAINHIAAVILPAVGGFLWLTNWRIPFLGAVILSLFSLVFVQFMKPDPDKNLI